MIKKEKAVKIEVRATEKMKNELEKAAKANSREVSDYVRQLYQYAIDNKLKF